MSFQQFHTAATSSFGSFVMGLLNVWPSYTIDLYKDANTTILSEPMTAFEASLVGSLPSLGAMLGTAMVGPLIDCIGRKKGGALLAIPIVISWLLISQTSSSIVILVARFLGGVPGGAYLVLAPMFISETAENSIRGLLASGLVVFYCSGTMVSYILGWLLSYDNIIKTNLLTATLCGVLGMTVVESPVYLLRKNREEEARAAIARYRGASPGSKVVLEELSRLKQLVRPAVELVSINNDVVNSKDFKEGTKEEEAEKEMLNKEEGKVNVLPKQSSIRTIITSPSLRRAFIAVFTTLTLQVCMGLVTIQVYAKDMFAHAAPSLSSHFCSVLFALVLLAACMISAMISDRAGRRILVISSSIMVMLTMASLGVLLQTGIGPAWLSAANILLYCFSFNVGAGTVPYVLLSEVFVPEVQSMASTLLIEWVWFLNFVIIGIFPTVKALLGMHGMMYVFASVGLLNAVLCYFIVPETKGLSNEEIQKVFLNLRKK